MRSWEAPPRNVCLSGEISDVERDPYSRQLIRLLVFWRHLLHIISPPLLINEPAKHIKRDAPNADPSLGKETKESVEEAVERCLGRRRELALGVLLPGAHHLTCRLQRPLLE